MGKLKIGQAAPAIKTTDHNGNDFDLATYKGKKVVLYFYPKDDTPSCTKQACNLRDNHQLLKSKGYVVVGVSADTQKKHQKFIQKYNLPFTLLMDEDKKIIHDYGMWQPKKFMGREFLGIVRNTFIINEEGIIEDIIEKVVTKDHTAQILKD